MCFKIYILLLWALFAWLSPKAQCLSGDSLWNRITLLRQFPPDQQLHELLNLKDSLRKCKSSLDSADAFLLQRIGVMYFKKTDYVIAVRYTLSSLNMLHMLERRVRINPFQKFMCYWNLNIYYDSLGLPGKRNEVIDSCITIGQNSNMKDSILLYALKEKIINLIKIGEYSRSIQYSMLSLKLAEKYGNEQTLINRQIFSWKINALIFLKEFSMVRSDLNNKIKQYTKIGHLEYIGNLNELWGDYFVGIGNIDSAITSYKKALQFISKTKSKAGYASSLNNIGLLYFERLQNYPKALKYYFKALIYSDMNESISILTNIGNVYERKSLFDSAFYYYQKAFNQVDSGLDENALLNMKNIQSYKSVSEYLGTLVLDKADAYLNRYKETLNGSQLKQTLAFYRKTDQVMDKIKEDQFELQSKLSWLNSARRLYEHAIEASWIAKDNEDALYFFEKSRAVLLDDQLKTENLMQNQEASDLFQIKSSINHLENQLDTVNPHSDHYSFIQGEIIKKKEEQDKLMASIRGKDPLYFARNSNADSMGIRDVQNSILKDHTALIEIFDGDSSVYTLTITNSGSIISKLDKGTYDSLSREYMSFISNPDLLNSQYPAFTDFSRKLYDLIFPDHPLPAGRIIVSPDGLCLPFEALINNKGRDIHYMLEDYCISYTYSARFLLSHFAGSTDRPVNDFMGMAPVEYAAYLNLSSLPGSDISLDRIKSHFRNVFIQKNDEASKNNFLLNFPDYKIVQVYSHASYSSIEEKPLIYFADSSMDLSELFSKERPAARLVVLSACETALGKDYKGEGVFSFSREFAGLGIPATISNLWSVDNESTYRITELFYEFLAEGLPTDEALQKAKLKFIKEGSREKGLPYFWASPILTGKAEIIRTKPVFPLWEAALLLAIAGLLLWIGMKKNSKFRYESR